MSHPTVRVPPENLPESATILDLLSRVMKRTPAAAPAVAELPPVEPLAEEPRHEDAAPPQTWPQLILPETAILWPAVAVSSDAAHLLDAESHSLPLEPLPEPLAELPAPVSIVPADIVAEPVAQFLGRVNWRNEPPPEPEPAVIPEPALTASAEPEPAVPAVVLAVPVGTMLLKQFFGLVNWKNAAPEPEPEPPAPVETFDPLIPPAAPGTLGREHTVEAHRSRFAWD